ncbi:conserved protein of unknown function [Bradyrhizobium vignae]|uniref:Uncharacterized protein n=1 Tax=Bradyrhizobium vignae TaxID=1549949 RepID=A0A2U3Q2R7_9BRAD|nr:conserved protein of unknown function [Bradyrhizobium vignae]
MIVCQCTSKLMGKAATTNGEFFRFAPHAYLSTYCIYMAGVFERKHDTIDSIAR